MIEAIGAGLLALFKALIPFLWEKASEENTAKDAPPVPADIRRRWLDRVRGN